MRLLLALMKSKLLLLLIPQCIFLSVTLIAQQTTIRDYVLFGGNDNFSGRSGHGQPGTPGAVQLGTSSRIQGGSVGSYRLIKSTGNAIINANVYCGGTIRLANNNIVTGRISAANSSGVAGTVLFVGPGAKLGGNIDVNGNINIVNGTVKGKLTHPSGTSYSGPVPAGGNITGAPALPGLPELPAISVFQNSPDLPDINSTRAINPGAYEDIKLPGNKTLTFSGPGVYVFNKIDNSGGTNYFVFDFKNNAAGTFKIYVHKDADLGKISVKMINGGSATRIFTEIHGNGSSCSNRTWGFSLANGHSINQATNWLGTVWAPYAGINIGSEAGHCGIAGALWSGKQVNIQCGVKIVYAPYAECNTPDVNAGPDKPLDFEHPVTLEGSSTTPGVTFSWKAADGGAITSPANTSSITVSVAGTYILTVTSATHCSATDTVIVTGKTNSIIGSELQSLIQNFDPNDPPSSFFVLRHDSIMIDVIAKEGRYAELLTLLTGPAYGLNNIISNGASNFIITGLFPINKLLLLNSLSSLIVYVRPYYAAFSNSGIVTSSGDTSIRSNLVRNGYQLAGGGIKIGVISDSYNTITAAGTNPVTNTAAQDIGNGDLPGEGNPNGDNIPVHVLQDYPLRSFDEGRGMLQIVHDVAPKAELYFRTGFLSPGDFALGIQQLNQAGCNIIVDDVTYITEPFLKDGVVANAVDAAVASGTTYFSAAGNFANKSYENTFIPVPAPGGINGTAHNFAGAGGNDVFQRVTLSPGNYVIVLQWLDDIYSLGQTATGGTKNDLDIYLTPNTNGTALFGFNRNNINGDPIEIMPFAITSPTQTNILITNNTPGSNPARFKYIVFKGDIQINEYESGTSTIVGQANATGAIAVGAARFNRVFPYPVIDSVESFSSTGGTFVNNVQRNKPELVAPDGVNTTVNLGQDYDGNSYANFFGTSAAAPHAAGVAALIMEGRAKFLNQPLTPPAEIRTILQSTATDMITPGFDFTSGYGFVNADSAMRSFATPTPVIDQLVVPPSVIPGQASFTLTVRGKYLSYNSTIHFRDMTLSTTLLNSGEATVQVPAFIGNPAISIYTPSISSSGLDGGSSDSLYFFSAVKKNIIVTADDKSKKYGEQMPALTATVLVDSIPIQNTNLSLEDLGLDSLTFITLANATSNAGTYIIRPSRIFDPLDSVAKGLLELYNYTFNQGSFTINKLPVRVTAQDTMVTYGQKIPPIQFAYKFDGTNIPDSIGFLSNIQNGHQSQLAKDVQGNDVLGLVNGKAVTIFNGKAVPIFNGQAVSISNGKAVTIFNGQEVPVVNAQALTIVNGVVTDTTGIDLTAAQAKNLSFLTTTTSLLNARQVTNQTLVNGAIVTGSTSVVDITQESILDYNVNAAQTYMLNSVSDVDAKGLVDITSFLNGEAITILNGKAVTIFNGKAVTIFNGKAVTIFNGKAVTIFNGDTIPIVSSQNKTAVIIDSNEIGLSPQSQLKSINMITGLTKGVQLIIPGTLLNDNFETTYDAGKLTILPAPLTVKAGDTTKVYGQPLVLDSTAFTISSGVLMYLDSLKRVTLASKGAGAGGSGGTHPIVASNAVGNQETDLSNYLITYENGVLTVLKAPVVVKANDTSKIYGDANPSFTASYTGLVNGQSFATSGITGTPGFSTVATTNSPAGDYAIVTAGGSLSSSNYSFSFLDGTLTIKKACLNVKADDKVICKGEAIPPFTARITNLKAGDNPGVSFTLSPSCTGSPGIYTIIPRLKPFANSKNYTVHYTNGKLYINPKGGETKKLRPYLDCVEQVSPTSYIAHFYCINDNKTPVYIAVGPDNKFSSPGAVDISGQPFIFSPGTTRFNVPFDGNSLKWELRTYEGYNKTLASASAGASSLRCNTYTSGRSGNKTAGAGAVPANATATPIIPGSDANVYPNPARNRATIYIANETINQKGLSLFDNYGKSYPVRMVRQVSKNAVEIDLSRLISGVYFMRVKIKDGYKTISIVKE